MHYMIKVWMREIHKLFADNKLDCNLKSVHHQSFMLCEIIDISGWFPLIADGNFSSEVFFQKNFHLRKSDRQTCKQTDRQTNHSTLSFLISETRIFTPAWLTHLFLPRPLSSSFISLALITSAYHCIDNTCSS